MKWKILVIGLCFFACTSCDPGKLETLRAAQAKVESGDAEEGFKVIRRLMRHKTSLVRCNATAIARQLREKARPLVPSVIELVDDPSVYVREEAIRALGEIGGPEARAAVPIIMEEVNIPLAPTSESYAAVIAIAQLTISPDERVEALINAATESRFDPLRRTGERARLIYLDNIQQQNASKESE